MFTPSLFTEADTKSAASRKEGVGGIASHRGPEGSEDAEFADFFFELLERCAFPSRAPHHHTRTPVLHLPVPACRSLLLAAWQGVVASSNVLIEHRRPVF